MVSCDPRFELIINPPQTLFQETPYDGAKDVRLMFYLLKAKVGSVMSVEGVFDSMYKSDR